MNAIATFERVSPGQYMAELRHLVRSPALGGAALAPPCHRRCRRL